MVRIELTVHVRRPRAEVFAYLADPGNLPEWQSGAVEATADGPIAVGTKISEVHKFLGRRIESTFEVTEFEPHSKFSLQTLSGPMMLQVHYALTEGDGTVLTFVLEGEPGGFFKLAEPLVTRQAERQFKSDLETLKDLLEAQPSD